MTQHYGPATWFLTLSPSEWLWEDLAEYIRQVNGPEMARKTTSELVAADPVSASRFLDNKFHAMLSFICSTECPIGEVTHYFWRREYQGRGTQHFHLLIWIKDAPVIGESSNDEVAQFITKHVTCKLPDKNISPTLYRRVDTHQRHKHNNYCLRTKKTKKGYTRLCRFGFPRPVTDTLKLRDISIAIAGRRQLKSKSRLYDLPRRENESLINDYNPVILTAWEGNMDIQFVGEKSTVLNWYCTKYTTKSESSCAVEIFDEINSTRTLASRLWSVALRSLNNRECGALEASDTLLGISLYGTDPDTTIKWLDVNIVRNRRVKSHNKVKSLDPECTDIFVPSLIDTHYPTRPEQLESLNLYDFAKWYDVIKIRPLNEMTEYFEIQSGLYLRKRQRGYLINHYKFNVNVNPEKYFYALLLMFQPWRDIDELKGNYDTYGEAFEKSKSMFIEAMRYHERLSDIQKGIELAEELIKKKIDEIIANETQDDETFDNPLGFKPIEAGAAMQELKDADDQLEVINVSQMISELNSDQLRVFVNVTRSMSAKENNEILRLFVSGAGGTGKSFLIKTLRCWTKQVLGKTAAVAAPTGLAAFNVDGLTIHRLFQLPVEHGGTPKYRKLSDHVLKILRNDLKDVVLFIIDEVSMISNVMLMFIHLRLSEIFNTEDSDDGWFGGKHIILLGDLLQLPPVHDQPAFENLSKDKVEKYFGSLGVINLWNRLFSYDELMINMRQQKDEHYKEILNRIRFGTLTATDSSILNSRKLKFVSDNQNERLEELCSYIEKLPIDTVCLFATRNLCDVLNTAMLFRIASEEIKLIAEDSVDCAPYLKKKVSKILNKEDDDSSRTAGLAKTIIIKIGAKVMIRRNIDVSLGIVNGTIGRVTTVCRSVDKNRVESLKIILSTGTECIIERVLIKFEVMDGAYVFRKQFPLSLSYGITIHKSQGLSLTNAVVDVGNSVFACGQAYVALSRVTNLKGLHLINLDPQSIKVQNTAVVEYNRLRQVYRYELPTITCDHIPKRKVKDTMWTVIKQVKDVQDTKVDSIPYSEKPLQIRCMENNDKVSCYANVVIQCIFHYDTIMLQLLKDKNANALSALANIYVTGNQTPNALAVRKFAGNQFEETIQQDASEFLMALCAKSNVIDTAIEHQLISTLRCNKCGLTSESVQKNCILLISVPDQRNKCNLSDLITMTLSRWTKIDSPCENCTETYRMQKIVLAFAKEVIILQLMIFSVKAQCIEKITDLKINAIPTTKLTLDDQHYRVDSAIFHHGKNFDSGHYTVAIRDDATNWVMINDSYIHKTRWPRGAKDAYIFVLKKVS